MKKLLIILIAACAWSCSSSGPAPDSALTVQVRLGTPQSNAPASARLWVWAHTGVAPGSAAELLFGELAGEPPLISQTSVNGTFSHNLPAGEYLVAVMLGDASEGRYSFLVRQLFAGAPATLTKVFVASEPVEFEEW